MNIPLHGSHKRPKNTIKHLSTCVLFLFLFAFQSLKGQITWYSYQSGNWEVPSTWTTDASGTLFINPSNITPAGTDVVILLNGRSIVKTTSPGAVTPLCNILEVRQGAVMDFRNTTNHSITTVNGQGIIKTQGVLPAVTNFNFNNTGGGTIEFNNTANFNFSGTITTFNNLTLNFSTNAIIGTLLNNLTINGNFNIQRGGFQINSGAGAAITIGITGNLNVSATGSITLGTGNYNHTLSIKGDFTNYGSVDFYELNAADYTGTNYGASAHADVVFNNAFADQNLVCNGYSEFYRIGVYKGSDWTYTLNIDADNINNFKLYGRNNNAHAENGVDDNLKALGLTSGTLRLGTNILIPCLTSAPATTNNYYINSAAQFIIDGAEVYSANVPSDMGVVIYGKLLINSGTFDASNTRASIITRETSNLTINGGTFTATQLRTSNATGTHRGAFIMTGGTLNLITNIASLSWADNSRRHATLSFSYPDNVFKMSGGTINILGSTPHIDDGGGTSGFDFSIVLGSNPSNISVTGGTINLTIPTTRPAYITSTVPFWNLNIIGTDGSNIMGIRDFNASSGTPTSVTAKPLVVLNDLTLQNNAVFNNTTNTQNVTVGRNFTVSAGTNYTPGDNVTTFNGTSTQLFSNNGIIGGGGLYNLNIENANATSIAQNLVVRNNLSINDNCSLQDMGRSISISGNIINSGTHASQASGRILITGGGVQTIGGDGTGIFGNLSIDKSGGSVSLIANQSLTGNLRLGNNGVLNIGTHNLSLGINSNIYDALLNEEINLFGAGKMIVSTGNQSDGGITKFFNSTSEFLFPIGTGSNYTPAKIQISQAPATWGSITIKPVAMRHLLLQGSNNSITYFWHTAENGFSGIIANSVTHKYYYADSDIDGVETGFMPGRYFNGAWTTGTTFDVSEVNNEILFNLIGEIDGDYTCGEATAFTGPTVFYSRNAAPNVLTSGADWNLTTTWSTDPVLKWDGDAAGSLPSSNNVVIIGDGTATHKVNTSVAATCGNLLIQENATLDLSNITGHNFGAFPESKVGGSGKLKIAGTTFPQGDWGTFLSEDGGVVEYYSTNSIGVTPLLIPAQYNLPAGGTAGIISYNHLIIAPGPGKTINFPNTDITVFKDLIIDNNGLNPIVQINPGATTTTVTVKRDLTIRQNSLLRFANQSIQNITVEGNTSIETGSTLDVSTSGAAYNNVLTVWGNIQNNGTLDMLPAANRYCNIVFKSSNNTELSGTTALRTRLNAITIDKGDSRDPVMDVTVNNTNFSLNTTLANALTLTNGTFRLSNGAIINLSTGPYAIPSSGCISVNNGTINIATASATANDLLLNGRIEVMGTGTMNIGTLANTIDNDIEYASGGTPEIIVNGGTLNVNGQVRRAVTINTGSLNYIQRGGTVNIFGESASNARSILEVLNPGSSFVMTNGLLNIIGNFNNASYNELYLAPETYTVSGGTVQLGLNGTTTAGTQFNIVSACPLGNLTVSNVNNLTVNQRIYPLTLVGDLTLSGGSSIFCTNGLDVNIGGNLVNNNTNAGTALNVGGFQGVNTTQITTFNGSGPQQITGTGVNITNFANLKVNTRTSLTLNGTTSDIRIAGGLTLNTGTLLDNANDITVIQNIENNSNHTSSSISGGIILAGSVKQIISGNGNGVFGNMNLNNPNGADIIDNCSINGRFTFSNGILYIDDYLLTLGETFSMTGNGTTRFVRLNGALSDQGVKKLFGPGIPAAPFTFPIGVGGKYTPVTYNITANSAASGSQIVVKPVNAKHPATNENPAATNELQYYWNVTSAGFSGLNVTHTYQYIGTDALPNETNYVAGYYRKSDYTWNVPVTGAVNAGADNFTISNINFIDGEFTCGVNIAPSPNFVDLPVFYSRNATSGGNWNDPTSWTLDNSGADCSSAGCVAGHTITFPNGNPVVIRSGHTITMNIDNARAYSVDVLGTFDLATTRYHSLGHISGNGTLRIAANAAPNDNFLFPGGYYDVFMSTPGSIVDFYGSNSGSLPLKPGNVYKPFQNVIFTGNSTKRMSSENMKVLNDLTIRNGSILNNTYYNKNIYLLGDWTNENAAIGGFLAGYGLVSIEGTSSQNVNIVNNIVETFYDLRIRNASGASITAGNGDVDVTRYLYLTSGNITTSAANSLTLNNTSINAAINGSASSFVNGPLRKKIFNNSSFNFPIGKTSPRNRFGNIEVRNTSTTGIQTWSAEYFDANPHPTYDTSRVIDPLTSVSGNEYWNVTGPASGKANVKLRWDDLSELVYATPELRQNLRVAEYLGAGWTSVGQLISDFGADSGTVETVSPVDLDSHVFTLGISSCPTVRITSPVTTSICDDGSEATINLLFTDAANAPFDFTYTINGGTEIYVYDASSTYDMIFDGATLGGEGDYDIEITNVWDNTGAQGIVRSPTMVTITVLPTPEDDITGPIEVGTNTTSAFSTSATNTNSYSWSLNNGLGSVNNNTTRTPTVDWGALDGSTTLSVIKTSLEGCITTGSVDINISLSPQPDIQGAASVCAGSTQTYYVDNNAGHSYLWSVTPGGAIQGSNTGYSISVLWGSAANDRIVSVVETDDGNGFTGTDDLEVDIGFVPQSNRTVNVINPTICNGASSTIRIQNSENNVAYQLRNNVDDSNVGSYVGGNNGPVDIVVSPSATTTYNILAYTSAPFNCQVELVGTYTVTVASANTVTLTSAASTTSQTVCVNTAITNITYTTTGATGATFSGLPTGVTGSWLAGVVTISGSPSVTAGSPYSYTVTLTGGCGTVTTTGTIAVTPTNTVTLTSAASTTSQTVCVNTAITNITYTTTGATGATFSGLPTGVTGSWLAGVVTISGSPSVTAGSPYSYTVTLTGGCGTVTTTGTIAVTPTNTVTLTSAASTTSQTVCVNTAITNITYTTTGATGATFSGLPTGVTGSWLAGVVTISGSPSVTAGSPYSYTVTLTGGCGTVTTTGTIAVTPTNTVTLTSAASTTSQTVCVNTAITNITYTTTGATGATFSGLPTGVTGSWLAGVVTISGSPSVTAGSPYSYTVTLTGGCGTVTTTGTIAVTPTNTVTLTSAASTTSQTVCVNTAITNITYTTTGATGATFSGLPTGVTGSWLAGVVTISGSPSVTAGSPYSYTVTLTGGCGTVTTTGTIAVTPTNTVTLTSAASTTSQTVCVNTAITNITYTTTGATGATFSGLPTGVTGSWLAGVVTISGSPSVTAGSPYSYTVTLTGGCGTVTTTGTIAVTPTNTVTLTSAASTTSQTVCVNTAITNITYTTTGATGATFSGLPTGVTGSWLAGVVTISGSPSVTAGSPYSYTVTLTGGCGTVTTTGTIAVTPTNTVTLTSAASTTSQTVCVNTAITNITYTTTGATGATFSGLPTGVTGSWLAGVVTISGSPSVTAGSPYSYTVTLTGGCGTVTTTGTIAVTPTNTVTLTSAASTTSQTVCVNTAITNITYTTTGATGATFSGLPTGVTGSWLAGVVTISGSPSVTAGSPYSYTVTLTGGCGTVTTTGTIAVTPTNTVTLTSAASTTSQTVCVNTAITNITYTTTGATGATFSGLPTGVTGSWLAGVVTISGSPSVTAGSPYSYTVTLTGGCGTVTTTGTIAVTPTNTVTLTSAASTTSQTVCVNTAITNITYTTTGATGATFSGLPTGVTGSWLAGVVTISGSPSVTAGSPYSYTVTLTGGCGTVTTTGTIAVTPTNTVTLTSAASTTSQTVCVNTAITNITYTTTGATGATFSGLPTGVTGSWLAGVVTISGSPSVTAGSPYSYTVTLTGGCGTVTTTGTIAVTPTNTVTLTSAASTTSQTVCVNTAITNITYTTTGATGATFSGLPTGVTGSWLAGVVTISGSPSVTAGSPYSYTVTLTGGCGTVTTTGTIAVTPTNTVTLTSAASTTSQTVCVNTAITNITYTTTGATGATFSGLPTGVTGSWLAGVVTISGSPSVTAGSPYSYTVTLTGGCGTVTTTGTIAVTPTNTVTLTSAASTTSQTVCVNTAITNITYTTTGATGATFSGLPTGVTGSWLAGVVTISGSPSVTAGSPYSYTVTLTGGCGTVTTTGTIAVTPTNTVTLTSAASTTSQTVCVNTAITNITYTTTGATGATFSGLPTGVTGSWLAGVVTISGSPSVTAGSPYSYTVTLTGGCGTVTTTGTIAVTPTNTVTLTSAASTTSQTVCVNTAITNITYTTTGATGATFSGLPTGVTGSWLAGVVTISGSPSVTAGSPYSYTVTLTGGCGTVTTTGTIAVTPTNTVTLTSAASTTSQTVCVNTAITNITYTTTGATGATFSGLPTGVTGSWLAGVVTISGSPSVTAGSPYSYTVTLTGGCGTVTTTGTIAVTPTNTVTLTSAASTTSQTVCVNTAITNITYTTTGATGATFSGLPTGVTGSWLAGVVTISGSPSVTAGSPYSYTVTLTGGCGTVTTTGTIAVTPTNTVTLTSAASTTSQTVCVNTAITNITYTTTGATGATFSGLPTGVTGSWLAGVVTISGSPSVTAGSPYSYTVTLTGGCGTVTTTGTIAVTPTNTVTLTSAASTTSQTVCVNTAITNITYTTTGATGATFSGLPTGVTGSWLAGVVTISGSPSVTAGSPYSYTVTLTGGCGTVTTTGTIAVTPTNTVTLTSAASTTSQTVCVNTAITNITYTTTGATGATFSGLPTGVTGSWLAGVVTISGSPSVTAGSPYSYTVTLTGGCGTVTTTGTIAVTPTNTVTLTSAASTTSQTVCVNTAITNITYTTTGATGATFSGLPTGVTGSWLAGVVTISGSPSVTAGSPYSYTVTLTGGCGTVTTTGTIAVTPTNTVTLTSAASTTSQTVCVNTAITNITYTTTGATGATFSGLPTGVTGSWLAGVVTISGSPSVTAGSPYSYTVTLTGGCGTVTTTGTIAVTPTNTVTLTSAASTTSQTVCVNTAITNITYTTTGATGATFSGLPTGVTGSWLAGVVTISGSPSVTAGSPYSYTVTLTGGCGTVTTTGTIAVTPTNTVTLTSAASTTSQTVCVNTAITNITYTTTGATGATFSGLPTGVTGSWLAGVVTISGSPSVTAGSPYSYTVTLTGGCGTVTTTGTIAVTPTNTVTLTSAASTTSQTVCVNTAITNITYTTTGATGATFSGLPTGVTGSWLAGVVTISGSPSVTAGSPYSYTVTLTGGCGTVTTTGTIAVTPTNTVTLTSAASTTSQTVCVNTAITNITYTTTGATGATFSGLPTGVTGSWLAGVVTISGSPSVTAGSPYSYTVTLTGGCGTVTTTGTIAVTPTNTVTLTSAASTTSQTVCVNTAITNITYTTTGATGATFSGLPTGVTGSWLAGVVTISGSPSVTAGSPYSYTVTLTGGCGTVTTTGTIAVTPTNTVTLTSAASTTSQTVCVNTAITNITYTTTGATGATFSGLPTGVTGSWLAGVVTISGSPSVTAGSPYSYTVTLTGGCGTVTTTGTIAVTPTNTVTLTSAASTTSQTVCVNTAITNITYTTTGATGATFSGLPTGVTGSWLAGVVTISGSPSVTAGSPYSYTVTLTGGCGTVTTTGTIAVTPTNTVTLTSAASTTSQTVCVNTAITNITYTTTGATGATFSGLPTGVTGSWLAGVVTISGSPSVTAGSPYSYTVTLTGGCGTVTTTGTIAVTPTNTVTLTSAASTTSQTVCVNTAITNITYTTTGATGATFSGLPTGVTGSWLADVVTISGSPSVTAGSPYSYTVTLTGGCGTVTTTGTIAVTPTNTVTLTSAASTTSQTVCVNTAITNITYTTTGATGATFSGLPTGVTGSWLADVVTISGSPSVTAGSPYSYTVTLTGGCGTVTTTGTIAVTPTNTVTLTSAASTTSQTVCVNTAITNITYTTTGATGATFSGLPTGVTGSWLAGVVTISGSPSVTAGSPYSYTVTLTGGCGTVTTTGTITVTACNLQADFSADFTSVCEGSTVTFTDESQGVSSSTSYQWSFGVGANPLTATGNGPHTVVYSTAGFKTVELIIEEGTDDTLTRADYIYVNVQPAVSIKDTSRCGEGNVEFLATSDGNRVDFSIDGGNTVAVSDITLPYSFMVNLDDQSSIQVWAKAYNTITGCSGGWDSTAYGISYQIPDVEAIQSSHLGIFPEGYVDAICSGKEDALYYVNGNPLDIYNWRVPELGIEVNNASQMEVDWLVAGGDYTIQLVKISGDGCSSLIRDTLVMVSQPDPELGSNISLCEGESHMFELDETYVNYTWQDMSNNATFTSNVTGEVHVRVTDNYGCIGLDTVDVVVHENPVVSLGRDTLLCEDITLTVDAGDFEQYEWSNHEVGNPIVLRAGAGLVSVVVTDVNGCQGTDEILIEDCSPENLLVIPNTFTPGEDDNIHKTWVIQNIYLFPDADIQVFDRWGRRVYQSDGGSGDEWDGKGPNGKDLPVDTYYYIIDLHVQNSKILTGTITIIR